MQGIALYTKHIMIVPNCDANHLITDTIVILLYISVSTNICYVDVCINN